MSHANRMNYTSLDLTYITFQTDILRLIPKAKLDCKHVDPEHRSHLLWTVRWDRLMIDVWLNYADTALSLSDRRINWSNETRWQTDRKLFVNGKWTDAGVALLVWRLSAIQVDRLSHHGVKLRRWRSNTALLLLYFLCAKVNELTLYWGKTDCDTITGNIVCDGYLSSQTEMNTTVIKCKRPPNTYNKLMALK